MSDGTVARVRACAAVVALCAGALVACGDRANGGSEPADLRALVEDLMPRLQELSALQATGPVRVERQTPAEVREFVERQLDEEMPANELEALRTIYVLLGMVPDSLDLRALLLDLYAEQIAGYYDPRTETLYVVTGATIDNVRPVVAHELVHALQDMHTDLDSLISRRRGNDRQTAAQSAIEGHATVVMFALLAEEASGSPVDPALLPNPGEQLRPALEDPNGQFPVFQNAPRVIRETLLYPYIAGAAFVQRLWRAQGAGAHTAPLDSLLPQSTEQVSDPVGRFLQHRDVPTELRFAEPPAWDVIYENTLGKLETGIFLEPVADLANGADAASGWDGDRYLLLRSPEGGSALLWYSVWDDEASADAFAVNARSAIESGPATRHGIVGRDSLEGRPIVRVALTTGTVDPAAVPPATLRCATTAGATIACAATS
jgi:hypothetical protein